MATQQRIPVWVKALDPLSQFGLLHVLGQRTEVVLITDAELAALQSQPATRRTAPPAVALVAVDSLDAAAVLVLRAAV
jgi:hypothetical protein